MTEITNPDVNIEELTHRIREEVAKRKASSFHIQTTTTSHISNSAAPKTDCEVRHHVPVNLPRLFEQSDHIEYKAEYNLADFFCFHGEYFVRNAYRGILRREPDASGFNVYLNALLAGSISKVEILGRLRFSREGRACAVVIHGLIRPLVFQSICRIPVLGYGVAIARIIVRLPRIIKNNEQLESRYQLQQLEHAKYLNTLTSQCEAALNGIKLQDAQLARVSTVIESKASNERLNQVTSNLVDLVHRKAEIAELSIKQLRGV